MPSTFFFIVGTVLLSLNLVRPFGLAVSDWFYFGAMLLALIETARFDRENFCCWMQNRFIWLAGLILLGAIISTSQALFLDTAIMEIFQQLYVVTLFTSLIWILVRRGKTNIIVQAFIWSGVFTASIAVIDYLTGSSLGLKLSGTHTAQYWGRYAGSLGHPNKLAYYLALTSTLSLARFLETNLLRSRFTIRLISGGVLSVQLFGLYLSGSLTGYLGFLLGAVALVTYLKMSARKMVRYSLAVLLIGVSLPLFVMSFGNVSLPAASSLGTSLISTALERVESNTANSRWYIFEKALLNISRNPLVGAGYDQISTSGIEIDSRQLGGTIHNMFLQNWYIGGFFAFLGWLLLYINLGWLSISTGLLGARKDAAPMLLGIAAATLSIILMDQFQDFVYQREKWLIIGLLVGLCWNIGNGVPVTLTQKAVINATTGD